MKRLIWLGLLFVLGLTACSSTTVTPTQTITEIAASDPQLSSLVEVLGEAGLVETLQGAGPFTVFSPTNEAFAALETSPDTQEGLRQLLLYHVVDKKLLAQDLTVQVSPIKTLQGAELLYTVENGKITLQDGQAKSVTITKGDIQATNGVIHIIDAVLLLPVPVALR